MGEIEQAEWLLIFIVTASMRNTCGCTQGVVLYTGNTNEVCVVYGKDRAVKLYSTHYESGARV